jgi:hypothetical protein
VTTDEEDEENLRSSVESPDPSRMGKMRTTYETRMMMMTKKL